MADRAYQYETSPKKLKPNYNKPKPNTNTKKVVKKASSKKVKQKEKWKSKTLVLYIFVFAALFVVIYKNSQINEAFSKIQNLKAQITEIQKENDQLEVSIQNSMNTNNLEQSAKELLGMQKLTNKQTVYISLLKKDYVEPKVEEIIIEDKTNIVNDIFEKIRNMF